MQYFTFLIAVLTVGWTQPVQDRIYLPAKPGSRPDCQPRDQTYCEEINDYPADLIMKILQKGNFNFSSLFMDEREGLQEPPEEMILRSPVRSRISRSVCHESLCPVEKKVLSAKAAIKHDGEWRYVIKTPLTIQLCSKPSSVVVERIQKYSKVKMRSLDIDGKIKYDWFVFPSHCSCRC
ncbi:uncharacterized protein [Centruroides vittatus]